MKQKGVSLIIIFFIMTIALSLVLGLSTILFNKIKLLQDRSNAVIALPYANSGLEQVFYYNRKQVPGGANRGLCNICSVCSAANTDSNVRCSNCVMTSLGN